MECINEAAYTANHRIDQNKDFEWRFLGIDLTDDYDRYGPAAPIHQWLKPGRLILPAEPFRPRNAPYLAPLLYEIRALLR